MDIYPSADGLAGERRHKFMAAVSCMDASIGRVLDRIHSLGLGRDTIVIFASDNGAGGGGDLGPLRGRKGQLFEGGVRVPFLMRWPGRIKPGPVSEAFLTALEIFPTLVAAAEAEPPAVELDGLDMLPVLMGAARSEQDRMSWEGQGEDGARVGKWKLVRPRRGRGLFDLSEDIGERTNLSDRLPEVLERVETAYGEWVDQIASADPRGPFRDC